jgi:hypothetical protein
LPEENRVAKLWRRLYMSMRLNGRERDFECILVIYGLNPRMEHTSISVRNCHLNRIVS